DGVDGQADAVDGDRAFGRDEAQQCRGRLDLEQPASAGGADSLCPDDAADVVDMAAEKMPSQPVGEPQRQLEIHPAAAIEPRRARERLGRYVKTEPVALDRDDGQAASCHRNTVAQLDAVAAQ